MLEVNLVDIIFNPDVLVFGCDVASVAISKAALEAGCALDANVAAKLCGKWYHALFTTTPDLIQYEEYVWMCERAEAHNLCTDLRALVISDAEAAIKVIATVMLLHYEQVCIYVSDRSMKKAANYSLPKAVPERAQPTAIPIGAVEYVCSKLSKHYKDIQYSMYMVQLCLYYFVAAWMHRHNVNPVVQIPGRGANGPWYADAETLFRAWETRDAAGTLATAEAAMLDLDFKRDVDEC